MYSEGIEKALRAALAAHDGQTRKCSEVVPYISHPLHVSLILARWGLEESAIQAGILHDVVEDCDDWTAERVRREFGGAVADIVAQLTEDKDLEWAERKQHAVDHVPDMSDDAVAVKAADKLHNLQSMADELRSADDQETVWEGFTETRENTLGKARELVEALEKRLDPRMGSELHDALLNVEAESGMAPAS